MDKIRCVKGRLEVANSVITDQTALKDNLICVYNICHFKLQIMPIQIDANQDQTTPLGKV